MPRPKRTRVASTRTIAKTTSPEPTPMPKQPIEPSSDVYDVSDREKGKAKQRRESMRDKNSIAHAQTSSMQQSKALEAARQRRDFAMDRLENMTSTSSNEVIESIEQSESSVELGRKVAGTPQHRRMADMSGLDLDDEEFDDLNTTFETAGPASAQRSAETSTMTTSVFKRRPRAGSFLNREDGYIRPSSRTGPNTPAFSSTFNIGLFKRRAREPSILGTAQKPPPKRIEPNPEFESEPESESEHDEDPAENNVFAPEDESTPLKVSKRRSRHTEIDAGQTSTHSPRENPRKRKSAEGHERRTRSSPFEENEPVEEAVVQQSESDLSSPPSTPPARQYSNRPVTPIMDEELMAPPLSSGSSAGESEIWPPLQTLARNRPRRPVSALRRTPVPNDDGSDISSPPSLTYSPNYREPSPPPRQAAKAKRRTAASKPEAKITTADLAGLLPRRRRRNARAEDDDDSEAEVDISGLGNDDDELSYMDVRARRRPTSRAGNSRPQTATKGRPASRGKGKQAPTNANRRATVTYGRTSDKENQGSEEDGDETEGGENDSLEPVGDGESSQAMIQRVGEELKNAARKFQEVDKWQLDYEEMTQSSSPRDAR
ncbi:uncharacterized protein GGS22DRAFT_33871 [Annulohypoxylon maeteangense]|uniref:uncharacterized protein n=1 Tax=Annulohypoxylon maeteangense TaxID=1927788 RepID=UPI00200877FF|nr:uncharacterized protein GGS22DRAFT_33871 [Annulohypoxylon maeteangense]KAI0883629.1 hypothetical protein GGS22DRAFT_33871 [Annulohypoxylon maeteangense]